MSDHVAQEKQLRIWETEAELPPEVFAAWHKPAVCFECSNMRPCTQSL